jgi:hypothetical protein
MEMFVWCGQKREISKRLEQTVGQFVPKLLSFAYMTKVFGNDYKNMGDLVMARDGVKSLQKD